MFPNADEGHQVDAFLVVLKVGVQLAGLAAPVDTVS